MSDLDIRQLDGVDPASDQADGELQRYEDALLQSFRDSAEGAELAKAGFGVGWARMMIQLGFNHLGKTVPHMSAADAEEILTELFPRKVTLSDPEEAEEVVPELTAFWRYLGRKHRLSNAPAILEVLQAVQPKYKAIMNDSSKFGMAKSFVMLGRSAGFDMSDQEQLQRFAALYNAGLAARRESGGEGGTGSSGRRSRRKQRKRIEKLSSQARRNNRKKRR